MLIALSLESLVPFALFGLFAAAAWWILDFFAADKSRTVERLDELKDPSLRRRNQEQRRQEGRCREPACWRRPARRAKPLTPKTELEANKLQGQAGQRRLPQRDARQRLPGPQVRAA